jgi:subfamily B ATP-binding cassette protein MsbA
LLDGLGLVMFLPLLQMVAEPDGVASSQSMGAFAFIPEFLGTFGLEMTLNIVLLTMLFFFTFKGLAVFCQSYLVVYYQQFFAKRLRFENIKALSNYSYSAFVKADAGEIQNTLSGEVARVLQGFMAYSQMLKQLILILTYAGLAFGASPKFAAIVAVGGVLSNFLFKVLYKKTKLFSKKLVGSNNQFQGLLIQQVAFFKYLKATGSIKRYAKYLMSKVVEIEKTLRDIGFLNSIMIGIREPILMAIVVSVIMIEVNFLGGALSTIIASLLFFYRALNSVAIFQTNYNRFLSFSGSIDKMQEFVKELKANRSKNGQENLIKESAILTLKNLSFSFNREMPILNKINLIIQPKETIAFVGESGSGKTTLINVIAGLLVPESGELLIGAQNFQDIKIEELQKRIGYITQEPTIFDESIYNNVTFWAPKTEENIKRFWDALKQAHILAFVEEQPDKEETHLGSNGVNLSGGQRQRISIARELYKEVDFLLLDEATSALDSDTERQIQNNFDELKGKYTIIIIAHRLSTIKNADRVVVLNKGSIDQIGTFKELISKSESFKKMVDLQEV